MSEIKFPRECFDNCVLTARHNITLEDLAIYAEFNDEIGAHGESLKSYLINSRKSYQSTICGEKSNQTRTQEKLLLNKGIKEGVEGSIQIIDLAIKEGFDLEWVKSALQIATAGMDLDTRRNRKKPLRAIAKEASARMNKTLELLKNEREKNDVELNSEGREEKE